MLSAALCACRSPTSTPSPAPSPSNPGAPYEVHEWGLVRAAPSGALSLGGPSAHAAYEVGIGKPVLYFHLAGTAPLDVEVTARLAEGGAMAESWPLAAEPGAPAATWRGRVSRGSCHHARLPRRADRPCSEVDDGCEAATLSLAESADADCITVGEQRANHLFYRGSVRGAGPLPLEVERLADGRVRVRNRGASPIPGVLLRVRLAHWAPDVVDAAMSATPPLPGETIELSSPAGSIADAAAQVSKMLREQGLTAGEAAAFRRGWDEELFGLGPGCDRGPDPHRLRDEARAAAGSIPPLPPRWTDSLVYFLPRPAIEHLSTLEFAPRPTQVRRALAAWLAIPYE